MPSSGQFKYYSPPNFSYLELGLCFNWALASLQFIDTKSFSWILSTESFPDCNEWMDGEFLSLTKGQKGDKGQIFRTQLLTVRMF